MGTLFTRPGAWSGKNYTLALRFRVLADAQLGRLLNRLWSHVSLDGCWLHNDQEPQPQSRVHASDHWQHALFGVAEIEGVRVPCTTVVTNDDEDTWVQLRFPARNMDHAFLGSPWQAPLDAWLRDVADHLLHQRPFSFGFVGNVDAVARLADQLMMHGVPDERGVGYLVPNTDGVTWHPATDGC